jgi:hypothetical protein
MLTEHFYTDKDQRTAFAASTKQERDRVEFCQRLIHTVKDFIRFAKAEDCDIWPQFSGILKREDTPTGFEFCPHPDFVKKGFARHLSTIRVLKRERPTRVVESKPKLKYWSPDKHLAEKFVSTSNNQLSI